MRSPLAVSPVPHAPTLPDDRLHLPSSLVLPRSFFCRETNVGFPHLLFTGHRNLMIVSPSSLPSTRPSSDASFLSSLRPTVPTTRPSHSPYQHSPNLLRTISSISSHTAQISAFLILPFFSLYRFHSTLRSSSLKIISLLLLSRALYLFITLPLYEQYDPLARRLTSLSHAPSARKLVSLAERDLLRSFPFFTHHGSSQKPYFHLQEAEEHVAS